MGSKPNYNSTSQSSSANQQKIPLSLHLQPCLDLRERNRRLLSSGADELPVEHVLIGVDALRLNLDHQPAAESPKFSNKEIIQD